MHDLMTRPSPPPLVVTAHSKQLAALIDEYELEVSVAEAQQAKTVHCMRLIADLYNHGYITIRQTMDMLVALDQTATYPEPYGSMWRQFSGNYMADFLDVMLKADRVGTRRIFDEIDRTLRPPPVEPIRPGVVRRLIDHFFGKGMP